MTSPSKIRVCGSKVRTGCTTCKKRRVKCDEQKPVCHRCSKGGRDCSYIALVAPTRHTGELAFIAHIAPRVHESLAFRPGEGHREQRALVYFRQRVGPSLGSPFDSDFFTEHLLLLADNDASVRAALVTLGSMYEETIGTGGVSASEYTLQHYSKAIRAVVDLRAADNPLAMEIALTTCILFACFESLRGHSHSCFSHWTAGLKVLQEYQSRTIGKTTSIIPMDIFRALYARIDSQLIEIGGSQFGNGVPLCDDTKTSFPNTFKSLKDAMLSLELLYNRLERFLAACERVSNTASTTAQSLALFYKEKSRYQHQHHRWRSAFSSMPAPTSILAASNDTESALLAVKLLNHVITLILRVDILDPEPEFDACLSIFQQIVDDAEAFLSLQLTQHSPSDRRAASAFTYTLSPCVVLPLYFAAARCRHSATRHRALRLLRSCRRREGLWDSALAAAVAERVVLMEEMGAEETSVPGDFVGDGGAGVGLECTGGGVEKWRVQQPPPRVRTVKVEWVDGQGGSRAEFSLQAGGLQAAGSDGLAVEGMGADVLVGGMSRDCLDSGGSGEFRRRQSREEHIWNEPGGGNGGDDVGADPQEQPWDRFRGMAFTELVRL